jgi:tetratricopeptide (TPR) repeat protein
MMGLKEFFTIKMVYPRLYPQYSSISFFHYDVINRLSLINLYLQEVVEFLRCMIMEQYREAIEKFKDAVKQKPEDAQIWCSWGVALVELQEYQEAVEKFQKALDVAPDFVPALYGCGFALTALGRKEEASEKFKKANELAPDSEENSS